VKLAVDKAARTECGARRGGAAWPARGDGGRWRNGVAARGERGDEAAARAFSLVS
jgi:hypothetical protein